MRRPEHRSCPRHRPYGFTLVELMVTLAVAGILLGLATWSMQRFIVGNRVNSAAREFMANVRRAQTIAARANRPVELFFINDGTTGCVPRYEMRSTVAGGADYGTVCLGAEYPGVRLSSGAMGNKAIKCGAEPEIDSCTLCTGTRRLTFFPTGAVTTSGSDPDGDSVVFSVGASPATARTVAVGIRNVSGSARAYRPNASGSAWECP